MIPSTLLMTFRAKDATPVVTSVSPASGSAAGFTSLTITGTGFTGATKVLIGGNLATSVVVVNSTTITCVSPAHAAGLTDVSVFVPNGGLGTKANAYTYVAVVPGVTTFNSGSGNYTVPAYNTLTVEVWSSGGTGMSISASPLAGLDGNASSVSTLGMSATAGRGGSSVTLGIGGLGGTGSGGNTTNSTGTAGGNSGVGTGGGAASGGGNVAGPVSGPANGNAGSVPGGGGSGSNTGSGGPNAGGGGGGYSKSVYAAGAITVGALLAYAVGAAKAAQVGSSVTGGSSAAGRVRFTVA